jgi:hypothetical protein
VLEGFFPGASTDAFGGHPTYADAASLEDDSYVNHDLLLAAARSGSKIGSATYQVDFPEDDYEYILEMEVEVEDGIFALDDNTEHLHSFPSVPGLSDTPSTAGSVVTFHDSVPHDFQVGDLIVGSHEGQWNGHVSVDHPFDEGITYVQRCSDAAMQRCSDAAMQRCTSPVGDAPLHPPHPPPAGTPGA